MNNKIGKAKYSPINTDWYYSYMDIPNLEIIKQELINLLSLPVPKKNFTSYYTNIYVPNIIQCPTLMTYLEEVGVKSKLLRILYSKSDGPSINEAPPHVDSVIPNRSFQYSLNIPLIDAEDSYTVWYEQTTPSLILYDTATFTGWVENKEQIREIARVQYTQPMLLNTSILHGGKITSNRRTIAGLRFWPELTDEEIRRLTEFKNH
jgi:hypothetical protein